MSASEFSNVNPTLKPPKEPIEVLKEQLDKNNFTNIKLLKSIHDESFDIANEFFSSKKEGFEDGDDEDEGFEDGDDGEDEGFEGGDDDDDDEGFEGEDEDDGIEGMKSKKKGKSKKKSKKKGGKSKKRKSKKKGGKSKKRKSKKSKGKSNTTNFDLIGWVVKKVKGTQNDEQLVKTILNSLFVTFLSFLIAHNWYYTFFTNPTSFRLEDSLSFLKENEFIHFFTMYIVQIVIAVEQFIMVNIPGKIDTLMAITPFGRRSIFYFIFSVSLGTVPYFLKQIKSIFFYFEKQVVSLIKVIIARKGLGKFFRDIISKAFNNIFTFKGNPALSSLIGVIYVMKFMENLVLDHSKGIIENATSVIPSFFTKLLAGSIFYIIYIIFKFAMFYQPTIAFSSFIVTAYLFYFSIVRLPTINGLGSAFSTFAQNNKHMNDGKVVFKTELTSGWKTNVEEVLKFVTENAHQIIMLFSLKTNFKHLFNIESKIFKTTFAIGGITAAAKLLFSIFEKYGIGNEEKQELDKQIVNLTAEIKNNIEAPASTNNEYHDMFEKIYSQYETIM